MTEQETVRLDLARASPQSAHGPAVLLFHPLVAGPKMRCFALDSRRTERSIGRSEGCDIHIEDGAVSRRHATLRREGTRWELVDHASANGVWVDGERTARAWLSGDEVLRIGGALLRYLPEGLLPNDGEVDVEPEGLVGGPALGALRAMLARAAAGDLALLVQGETGTGKEVAARFVHERSPRRDNAFVAVNCAALPATLLESELFGHARGAYTGAAGESAGLIRQAHRGTLLLDEIGELPPEAQAKLLRVLQDRTVRPVGSTQPVLVDFRLIAATNRDLGALVRAGAFRADLYARIAEVQVELPPLRSRFEDVPLLVAHLLRKHGAAGTLVAIEALDLLCRYRWPFNVRELESAVRRALGAAEPRATLEAAHFGLASPQRTREERDVPAPGAQAAQPSSEEHLQATRLREALRRHAGDPDRAAAALGISRSQLYRRARKYGIEPGRFRA